MARKKKATTLDDLARMVGRGFVGVDKRFDQMDKRFSGIEKRLDEIDKRLGQVEADVGNIRDTILAEHRQRLWAVERAVDQLKKVM